MQNLLSNCCVACARSEANTLSARGGGCGGRSSSLLLYRSPPHSRERWRRTPPGPLGALGSPPDSPLSEPALARRPGRSILDVLISLCHHICGQTKLYIYELHHKSSEAIQFSVRVTTLHSIPIKRRIVVTTYTLISI